jgi:hypothetical protein
MIVVPKIVQFYIDFLRVKRLMESRIPWNNPKKGKNNNDVIHLHFVLSKIFSV